MAALTPSGRFQQGILLSAAGTLAANYFKGGTFLGKLSKSEVALIVASAAASAAKFNLVFKITPNQPVTTSDNGDAATTSVFNVDTTTWTKSNYAYATIALSFGLLAVFLAHRQGTLLNKTSPQVVGIIVVQTYWTLLKGYSDADA